MFKRLILPLQLAFGLFLFCATPASAQDGITATQFAANLQQLVGQDFGAGLVVTSVRAEGNIVVITVDGTTGWGGYDRSSVGGKFAAAFCQDDDAGGFFQNKRLRIDTTERGQGLQAGNLITACPVSASPQ